MKKRQIYRNFKIMYKLNAEMFKFKKGRFRRIQTLLFLDYKVSYS